MSRRKSRKRGKTLLRTLPSATQRLTRGTGASMVCRAGRAVGSMLPPQLWGPSVGLGQHFDAPAKSNTQCNMFLKACKLLCLLDPALSVSFRFSPFLSFSPWEGCTLTDTAVSSSGIGPYCTVLSGPSPWELNSLHAHGYSVCSKRHYPER